MKKLMSTLPNMVLSLGIICAVSGAALSSVNLFTADKIAASKQQKLVSSLKTVVNGFDNDPVEESLLYPTLSGDSLCVYPAKKEGRNIGAAVEGNSSKGFSGNIRVLVGFDPAGKLLDYSVLEQTETPGLGTKMEEWFRTAKNNRSVLGKELAQNRLKIAKDGGDIDGITAATISSRAFLDALNRAYEAFAAMYGLEADGITSATGSVDANSSATGNSDDNETEITEAKEETAGETTTTKNKSASSPATNKADGKTKTSKVKEVQADTTITTVASGVNTDSTATDKADGETGATEANEETGRTTPKTDSTDAGGSTTESADGETGATEVNE